MISFSQATAAETYGIDENSIENLIKVNVFYTSLNEKTTEDVIDYNIEVKINILGNKSNPGRDLL